MGTSCTVDPSLQPVLAQLTRRILQVGSPRKIVLFGSWARGGANPSSDLDLLIVEDDSASPRYRRATPYRMALLDVLPDRDVDIVVWTPEEIEEWRNVPQAFISTALREGLILYEESR